MGQFEMKPDCTKVMVIEWLDSKGITREWEFWEEIDPLEPSKCVLVGFLIEETDTFKTIAQSISDTQVIGSTTIPCCSIQSEREVLLSPTFLLLLLLLVWALSEG